jgi:hypothetical protein
MTGDASGILNLNSNGTNVVAVSSTGVAVTGTLSATGAVTLTTALPVLSGGTGVTTSTGTGAGVHSVGPSISSAVMTTMASSVITSGTAVATTSGTSVDFTSIPSWVKRITVMFNGVSLNGTSIILIQLGDSGGIETSGYTAGGNYLPGTGPVTLSTTGFGLMGLNPTASTFHDGFITLALQSSGTFTWVETGILLRSDANLAYSAGAKSLSATLDRVRITTVNGTDAFDAGSINILYE